MKYLNTFEGFKISGDDMGKYTQVPMVNNYLTDKCAELKKI